MDKQEKTITPLDQQITRVTIAFSRMPFGGICHFERIYSQPGDPELSPVQVLERIANNLETLAHVLKSSEDDRSRARAELEKYRRAATGLRFLLTGDGEA